MVNSRALIISLVLAAVAALLVYTYIDGKEKEYSSKYGTLIDVLVANQDIDEYQTLNESMVFPVKIPKRFAQPTYLSDPKEVRNAVASVPIKKGEQIIATKLLLEADETGLSSKITIGKRAVAIQVTPLASVGGLIKPGDRIDIMVNMQYGEKVDTRESWIMLQDILVVATGQNIYNGMPVKYVPDPDDPYKYVRKSIRKDNKYNEMILEVNQEDAVKLHYMINAGAMLYAILRNPADRETNLINPINLNTALMPTSTKFQKVQLTPGAGK